MFLSVTTFDSIEMLSSILSYLSFPELVFSLVFGSTETRMPFNNYNLSFSEHNETSPFDEEQCNSSYLLFPALLFAAAVAAAF